MEPIRVLFVHTEVYNPWNVEPLALHIRQPLLESYPDHFTVFDHVCRFPLDTSSGTDSVKEFQALLATVSQSRPNVIFISQSWHNFLPELYPILKNGGAKLINVLWDTPLVHGKYELEVMMHSDYVINLESVTNYLAYRYFGEHILRRSYVSVGYFAGYHLPRSVFRFEPREKRYPVVMLGSNEGERQKINETLKVELGKRGLPFYQLGGIVRSDYTGRSSDYIDYERYLEIVWRSEILLSSQTNPLRRQMKGKVLEFLACGGFCLTDLNVEYMLFFPAGTIAYYQNTTDHLVEQICYYHERPDERRAIAERGHAWYQQEFADRGRYWVTQIERAAAGGNLWTSNQLELNYRQICENSLNFNLVQLQTCVELVRSIATQAADIS